jgi:hypothetical protein
MLARLTALSGLLVRRFLVTVAHRDINARHVDQSERSLKSGEDN